MAQSEADYGTVIADPTHYGPIAALGCEAANAFN